ncbi:MAG: DUF4058 family protein [Cyanobacteria bacterium J06592_8]
MPSPFPGMNPYLEHPDIWRGFHSVLVVKIAEFITSELRPKYSVYLEFQNYKTIIESSVLMSVSDISMTQPLKVEIPVPEVRRKGYLEIREVSTKEVVTVIELLSPVNKRSGKGRETYNNKREQIFGSRTHFVEIDFLRMGEPMLIFANGIESDYRILVSRGDCRPSADLYAFNLPQKIPAFPIPLRSGDREPLLDLQFLLNQVYDRAGYDLKLDYTLEPIPPLSEIDTSWIDQVLKEKELRD